MGRAFDRGKILYGQARYAMAINEFRKELAEDPDCSATLSMLALSLHHTGKSEEGLAIAQESITKAPDKPFPHYALACILMNASQSKETYWSRHFLSARYRMAQYRRGVRKAMAPAQEAVRLDPRNADYLLLLGAFEFDLGNHGNALELLDRGLAENPNHVRCANLRAKTLLKLGRIRDAKETLQTAMGVDPENPAIHATSGITYLKSGEREKAVQHLSEAVRLNPNDAQHRFQLKMALKKKAVPWFAILYGISMLMRLASHSEPAMQAAAIGGGSVVFIGGYIFYVRRRRRKNQST